MRPGIMISAGISIFGAVHMRSRTPMMNWNMMEMRDRKKMRMSPVSARLKIMLMIARARRKVPLLFVQ